MEGALGVCNWVSASGVFSMVETEASGASSGTKTIDFGFMRLEIEHHPCMSQSPQRTEGHRWAFISAPHHSRLLIAIMMTLKELSCISAPQHHMSINLSAIIFPK